MAEYIEREAAQKVICDYCDCEQLCDRNADCYVAEAVKAIPAADVRHVVTCGECKHWFRIKKDCILASCELDALVRSEDFFCAAGEREVEHE